MFRTQPKLITPIDRSTPIGAMARCVILPSAGLVDLAYTPRSVTLQGSCVRGTNSDGAVFVNTSTSNSGVLLGSAGFSDIVPTTKTITFFSRVYVAGTGVRQQIWGDYTSGGSSPSVWIQASAANAWEMEVWPGLISGGTVTVGWHTVVGTQRSDGSAVLWVDGAQIGTATSGTGRPAGSQAAWLGPGAYTLIGWNGSGSLGVICEGDISQTHAVSFHNNPWHIFQDPDENRFNLIRSAYVAAAGGGTFQNLVGRPFSLAGAHGLAGD